LQLKHDTEIVDMTNSDKTHYFVQFITCRDKCNKAGNYTREYEQIPEILGDQKRKQGKKEVHLGYIKFSNPQSLRLKYVDLIDIVRTQN
jgi:hypothetical protein